MHLTSVKKIEFLQEYAQKMAAEWHAIDKNNITGIGISKKIKNGKKSRYYAITFNVIKKTEITNLLKKKLIPPNIIIEFPDGKSRIIKTDVQQTGIFKFESSWCGAKTKSNSYGAGTGSLGLFVMDNNSNKKYAITNYHVVADKLINQNIFHFPHPGKPLQNNDVQIKSKNNNIIYGSFVTGSLNKKVDVAFLLVTGNVSNTLPNNEYLNGYCTKKKVLNSMRNSKITIYSNSHPTGISSTLKSTSFSLFNSYIDMDHLIQLDKKISQAGDSGSLAINILNSVVGLVIGSDDEHTYLCPFYEIWNFKHCKII